MRDQAIKPTLVDLAEEMLPHTATDQPSSTQDHWKWIVSLDLGFSHQQLMDLEPATTDGSASTEAQAQGTLDLIFCLLLPGNCWLVVWNILVLFHNIWDNSSH